MLEDDTCVDKGMKSDNNTHTTENYVLAKTYPETSRISGNASTQIYNNLAIHIRTSFDKNRRVLTHGRFMWRDTHTK